MAEELERPPLKDIYRKLIADNETNEVFKKYSYNSFRDRMLNNPDASSEVADFLIDRGIIRDKEDWQQNWLAPSVVKQAPTPTKSAPVQVPTLLQPAQPSGQPSLTAVTGQQAVTPMAAPQGPNFQQFDSQKEIDQAALSPVFKENQLALSAQKDGLIMPTKEAEQDFNQLPADQQRAAIEGGTGNQLGKDEAARKRTWGQTFSNLGSQLGALGQNIKSKVDSGLQNISGYIPTSVNFMIPGTKEYDEGFLYRQNRKRAMFDKAQEADKALQDEATKNNIETSVIDAIGRGEYGRVPEAVGYNIGQAGLQILPTIFTGGYSMFLQTLPDAYKSGVERMAEERGITPQEVIDGGYDSPIITNLSAGVQMMLEKAGAGFVQKSLASKGGISAFKDWLKKTAMGETAVGAAIGEGVTEAMQTDVSRTFDELAASSNSDDFMEKLNIMYADPEFWDEIVKSAEGGVLGGGGLSVTGGAIKSALSRIGGKKGPSTPPTSLGGIPVENVPESAPEFEPEVPTNEQAVQDDQAILEGQQRSGFQFVPPTQSLPQEAKSLMQSVVQGKMVSVQPVKDLLEGLYNEYKIFRNQAESTNRTLTQSQIDEGVKDYEGAMDLLGEYISKRDGGTFMQEFAARAGKDGGVMVPGGEFEGPQIEQTDETIPIGQRAAEVIQTETTPAAEEVVPVAKEESVDDGERNSPKEYSKKISLIGSEFNFDKPQRKNYPEGVEGDKQYGIDNIKHNEAVDNVIGNLTQEGTLTDNEGNKYGVTITSQGVRVVGLLADGSESENIVYRKGQRRTGATPFTNGFRFKANETTTTTTPTTSLLGETTEATGQTGGGLGTDVPETQEQGTDQIPVADETPLNPAPIPVAADATGGTTADVGTEPVADESGGSKVEVEPVLAEEVSVAPAEEEGVVKENDAPLTKDVAKEGIPVTKKENKKAVSKEIADIKTEQIESGKSKQEVEKTLKAQKFDLVGRMRRALDILYSQEGTSLENVEKQIAKDKKFDPDALLPKNLTPETISKIEAEGIKMKSPEWGLTFEVIDDGTIHLNNEVLYSTMKDTEKKWPTTVSVPKDKVSSGPKYEYFMPDVPPMERGKNKKPPTETYYKWMSKEEIESAIKDELEPAKENLRQAELYGNKGLVKIFESELKKVADYESILPFTKPEVELIRDAEKIVKANPNAQYPSEASYAKMFLDRLQLKKITPEQREARDIEWIKDLIKKESQVSPVNFDEVVKILKDQGANSKLIETAKKAYAEYQSENITETPTSPFTAFDPPSESMSREQGRKADGVDSDVRAAERALEKASPLSIDFISEKIKSEFPYRIKKTFDSEGALKWVSDGLESYSPNSKEGKRLRALLLDPATHNRPKNGKYLSDASGQYWSHFTLTKKPTLKEISEAYHKAKQDGSNPELVTTIEELINSNKPQSPFESFKMKGEEGRKARADLKEKVGKSEFARMENIHKNSEKILRGLEKNGTLKIECP